MIRRIAILLASAAMLVPLAACDFRANGSVECHDVDGATVCTGTSTSTPGTSSTTPPPVTTPPATTDPPAPTTAQPPPVTSEPTTAPPTTTQPVPALTAAERFGWGTPVAAGSDEFDGTTLDRGKWGVYEGAGHAGNGRRVASANAVQDGYLRQTGLSNGDSAGLASHYGQKYGRWEVRARSMPKPGASGNTYHPVLITWPDSDQWPAGAEYDFLENSAPGENTAEAYLHFPNHQPRRQEHASKAGVDLSVWHNFGFEWTPDHVKGFIDGVEWFSFDQDGIQNAPGPMHQTIQLDNFSGSGMQEAWFDIDFARAYKL